MKSLSHIRLCNPMDCSLPGSTIHGIFQARTLEWVAILFFTDIEQVPQIVKLLIKKSFI